MNGADYNTLIRVQTAVSLQTGIITERLLPPSDLYDDLACDSLDIVELTMSCEEEFDIQLADEVMEQVRTIGDLVKAIDAALYKAKG